MTVRHALHSLVPILLACLFALPAVHVQAQQEAETEPPAAESTADVPASSAPERPDIPTVEAAIAELAPQIESAEAAATEETVLRLGVPIEALSGRADRLRALSGVLQQQIGALQRLEEIEATQADLEQERATFQERGLDETPPYQLVFADRLQDDASSAERNLEGLESQLESADAELRAARERLGEAQRQRRAARDALEANANDSQGQRLIWEANRARLEERYFEELVISRTLRRDVARTERALADTRFQLAQEKAQSVLGQTAFSREELDGLIDKVVENRDAIERLLPKLRDTHQANEALRREARDALQRAQGERAIANATTLLASRTARVETAARVVELTEKRLALADHEKLLWERRYAVWHGMDDTTLGEWETETERFLEELERDRQVQEARLIDLRSNILDTEKQLQDWTGAAEDKPIVESRLEADRRRESALNDYLAALLPVERLAQRLADDIDRERQNITWEERWQRIKAIFSKVWNFEIFAFEDNSITIRKLVIAFAILIVGIFLAGFVTRNLRSRLLSRTPITENAAAAIEKLAYYAAIIVILLYALNSVNIPLTLFAFFGGAIAIAVGFGAQHVINNFISGFILMLERPIRIGDLVQVEGVYGHIRQIGARSTRLHTAENIDLLIPNGKLLENTVTNWTLSDEKLRTYVVVGVVYGSPTQLVTELLTRATTESKKVLETPKPVVLFTDFGDNALMFEVHFWIKMRRIMDKRQAESEVRYNIDRLFGERGIVIAFPQRDVHLNSVRPLEIKMVTDGDEGTKHSS